MSVLHFLNTSRLTGILLTDPAAPGHVYAGLSHGEIWHSTDYGDH